MNPAPPGNDRNAPRDGSPHPPERRRHPRLEGTDWSGELLSGKGGNWLSGKVLNQGPEGLAFRLYVDAAPFLPGVDEMVILRLHGLGRGAAREVVVRWVRREREYWACGLGYRNPVRFEPSSHSLDLASARIDPACALKIPVSQCLRRGVLAFAQLNGVTQVACEDAGDGNALDLAERMLKTPVQLWQVPEEELQKAIFRVFGNTPPGSIRTLATPDSVGAGDELLHAAFLRQASDIHIDPGSRGVLVRFRVDGQLEPHAELPLNLHSELVSRFKVMAGMDIAEKRAPQDGRFTYQVPEQNRQVDIRAATLPTKYGERLNLRLLALETEALTLDRLGLDPARKAAIEGFLRRSQGMMILTGPTGSGKTTTLYASLRLLLAERNLNVMTIEDPIEYAIDGVAQCEVDNADKVSFAKALRSILRHDPDVVMIGEIRDGETANIAIKAALTGHLVLGTLHTNSAAASITRLLDMGVEPYLVAGTLRLAIAQRLSRRLCRYCRLPRPLTEAEAMALSRPDLAGCTVYEPHGCLYCAGRGYAGRTGLYELLEMNSAWAREIAEGAGESRLLENMRQAGAPFLEDDAVAKLLDGALSVDDALQIVTSW